MSAKTNLEILEQAAQQYANSTDRQSTECPRHIMNPGLYYGFKTGANFVHSQYQVHLNEILRALAMSHKEGKWEDPGLYSFIQQKVTKMLEDK